jgi:hypothetical protein
LTKGALGLLLGQERCQTSSQPKELINTINNFNMDDKLNSSEELKVFLDIDMPNIEQASDENAAEVKELPVRKVGVFVNESEADILRKAMGKKDKDKMDALKEKFIEGAVKKEINKKKLNIILKVILKLKIFKHIFQLWFFGKILIITHIQNNYSY